MGKKKKKKLTVHRPKTCLLLDEDVWREEQAHVDHLGLRGQRNGPVLRQRIDWDSLVDVLRTRREKDDDAEIKQQLIQDV
jgi:hypothetical protein